MLAMVAGHIVFLKDVFWDKMSQKYMAHLTA